MKAGTAKYKITPDKPVWMDGMIREHKSEGVHDDIHARVLALIGDTAESGSIIVSVEVAGIKAEDSRYIAEQTENKTGIPRGNVAIAATHTHSAPATVGYFQPDEPEYRKWLCESIIKASVEAVSNAVPVTFGSASGTEKTISHYRRLLADDGSVVMNWEDYPPEKIKGPLGQVDPEVGVLRFDSEENSGKPVCILFNHAGHPNVMSGENYLISGDYPGLAMRILEERFGCTAMFVNGAQGTMDIDGLRDRDWEGVGRTGNALAKVVIETADSISTAPVNRYVAQHNSFTVPPRKITDDEYAWAEDILSKTGGTFTPLADGVGDDYKAYLYKKLREKEDCPIDISVTSCCIEDTAIISFPGELFTEAGMMIKKQSPFAKTYILGLANGKIGYVPPRKAIHEGGYAVATREVGDEAAAIITEKYVDILRQMYSS